MADDVLDILSSLSPPSASSPSAPYDLRSEARSEDGQLTPTSEPACRTKSIVLIRHGRSSWNEFLGAHKRAQWEEQEQKRQASAKGPGGMRNVLRSMVGREGNPAGYPPSNSDLLDLGEDPGKQSSGGFWQGVRGGLKHVGNALNHAGKLNQVDHPLSAGGLTQARQLRQQIAALAEGDSVEASAAILLQCRRWYISPFLRALQTAAYALSPLRRLAAAQGQPLQLRVTPQANEIVQTSMSLDCQGKKGNVGFRVVTRAVCKTAETLEEEEDDVAQAVSERQQELADVTATLCALDISEIAQVWWTEVSSFKKEHLRAEDKRVKSLVKRILVEDEEPIVGLIGHSILFKRMIQLFWPKEARRQEEIRAALRNGAGDTIDPFDDKVMNCGTLVLTFRYSSGGAEIIKAAFLFDGHMESALGPAGQTQDPDDVDVQDVPEPPRSSSPGFL
ncbi:unnamed protein product [Effrenium voratum]|uniref:Uncharacterized protein n=1 Tax=Effrenium voratum TaxID=2562239 RepID=A0AA36N715_9DINO|nr:unnamed protein product [Effrenium voratum]